MVMGQATASARGWLKCVERYWCGRERRGPSTTLRFAQDDDVRGRVEVLELQEGDEAGVVVGPEAGAGDFVYGDNVLGDGGIGEEGCIVGDEDPGGSVGSFGGVGGAVDEGGGEVGVGGEEGYFGGEVYVLVGDVEGEDSAGGEVALVEGDGLGGEEVEGDGVAGEGVDY